MRNREIKSFLTLLLALALLAGCGGTPAATTMHLRRAEGRVGVFDDAGKNMEAREDLGLYSGYGVETNRKSYAWIDLDEVKLTKLDEQSEIEITKEDKELEIELLAGALFFQVTEPLEDDEMMTIRSSTMSVGIRGTCGWVVLENNDCLMLYLLEGDVECAVRKRSAPVTAGQMARMSKDGEIEVVPFAEDDIPDFVLDELDDDFLDEVLELLEEAAAEPAGPDSPSANPERPPEPDPIVLASEPPLNEWALKQPVPDFLDEEQRQLFLHAYCAYSTFLSGNPGGITSFPLADGSMPNWDEYEYETVELGGQTYTVAYGRYGQWADFQAMMDGLFTPEYSRGWFRSTADGRLCYLDTGRGSDVTYLGGFIPMYSDTYELVSQSENEIYFNLIGYHHDEAYAIEPDATQLTDVYTVRYPIRMVRTDQGWRVAEFDAPW